MAFKDNLDGLGKHIDSTLSFLFFSAVGLAVSLIAGSKFPAAAGFFNVATPVFVVMTVVATLLCLGFAIRYMSQYAGKSD